MPSTLPTPSIIDKILSRAGDLTQYFAKSNNTATIYIAVMTTSITHETKWRTLHKISSPNY